MNYASWWWPVRSSNHWVTWIKITSAKVTFVIWWRICTTCNNQWDALTTELHGLIRWVKGYICVQPVTFWWPVRYSNHWTTWTDMMSEGYICVQPVTFWRPVRCFNHWTTWTDMMSEGYICVQPVTFWRPVRCSNLLSYMNWDDV